MIGLLGGIGPVATCRYYEGIVAAYHGRTGRYPPLAIVSLDFDRFTQLENRADPKDCINYVVDGLKRLADAGATVVAMTANSPHVHLEAVAKRSPLPLVSIVDPVIRHVTERGYRRLLLLAIRATVRGGVYQRRLETQGVSVSVPSPDDQALLDGIIFGELARGVVRDNDLRVIREIAVATPSDAVVLGCTELPLLLATADLGIPVIDTLALHVDAIVKGAVSTARDG